ncbi:unnamed protein product [Linum trigynum]|uniref:Uncharacterized protein n=1 Tax=Linum trigynum TaxID=586398 RepID=A0AAV2EXS4_9ROSI
MMDDSSPRKWVRQPRSLERKQQLELREGEEGLLGINAYGSNLLDPTVGGLKRSLEKLEGDVAESPTPRKQFVEDNDGIEKVEEASLEWPRPDK